MKIKPLIVTLFLLLIAFQLNAQSNYYLKILNNDKTPSKQRVLQTNSHLPDTTVALQIVEHFLNQKRDEGFLTISSDSMVFNKDTITVWIWIGKKFNWVSLSKGNVNQDLLKQAGFKERFYSNKPFSLKDYRRLQKKLISIAENKGNPFASIKLDSVIIKDEKVKAVLNFNAGPPINFDTLTIVGSAKIKPKFLENYYKVGKGRQFSRSKITDAERSITQFPSIKLIRPTDILYSNYKAYPIFFLDHRPANSVDGIIGFLPNENGSKKLLITGQCHLNLFNLGGTGKDLIVEWNKLKPLSQLLNLQFNNYNLIKTGLDFEGKFHLLKEDTSFVNIIGRVNLSKALSNNSGRVNLFTEYKNSRIGNVDVSVENPDSTLADFNLISYGLGYLWQKIDDSIFPRRGLRFSIDGQIGNKTIRRNAALDSSYYSNFSHKTLQAGFSANLQTHIKISKKTGCYGALSAGALFNNQLFLNDMYRIGGLKTLRGFNENYFFASKYGLANLEFRYFYEEGSYFMLFYDQAYLLSEYLIGTKTDYPLGLGGGINLKTSVGTLQIVYSLGKSKDQSLGFNYSKVHFGIISRF